MHGGRFALALASLALPGAARAQAARDLAPPDPAPAPDPAADRRVAERLLTLKALTDISPARCRREAEGRREIVVCADPEKRERERLPLRGELESARSGKTGVPRAPNLDTLDCHGKPGCISVGGAPAPVYFFDIAKLPEAPAGSAADRIAKGEAPPP